MAIPTNLTPATAAILSTLPATITQTVDDSGTTYTVWYRYTATATDALIGVYAPAASPYLPRLAVFLDPAGAAYLDLSNADKPVQFPATVGTTYYFSITPNSGNPSPAALTLSVESLSNQAVPLGSLLVNDDTAGFPGILLSVTADNAVLGTWPGLAVGEGMGILADGTIAASLDDASDTEALTLYRADRSVIATVPWFTTSTDQSQTIVTARETAFYVVNTNAAHDSVIAQRVTPAGAVTHTWTIAIGSNTFLNGASVSPDQATLYYVVLSDGADSSLVYSYNLTTSTPIGTAIAAQTSRTPTRLLCLADGTIVVLYRGTSPLVQARLFTSGGTFVRSFAASGTSASDPRIATSAIDPAAFWTWTKNSGASTDVFEKFQTSDASVLATVTGTEYESGVFRGSSPGATPVRFGHSESCDFVELRTAAAPPTPIVPWPITPPFVDRDTGLPIGSMQNIPIRRVRRSPHFSTEQLTNFFDFFQLDIQPGVGNIVNPGQTPVVFLSWSDDGGYTWSNELELGTGPAGAYRTRVYSAMLGSARDRVWQVSSSDPVFTVWLNAFIRYTPGLS